MPPKIDLGPFTPKVSVGHMMVVMSDWWSVLLNAASPRRIVWMFKLGDELRKRPMSLRPNQSGNSWIS